MQVLITLKNSLGQGKKLEGNMVWFITGNDSSLSQVSDAYVNFREWLVLTKIHGKYSLGLLESCAEFDKGFDPCLMGIKKKSLRNIDLFGRRW